MTSSAIVIYGVGLTDAGGVGIARSETVGAKGTMTCMDPTMTSRQGVTRLTTTGWMGG